MKVDIDFSIYSEEEGAYGSVSGEISVNVLPHIGDTISFLFSGKNIALDPLIGFDGMLEVTNRIISANREDRKLALSLGDVVVPTKNDALKLMQYLESAFDLFADIYE